MDEEAETKAIDKWLRMVDKPLETKEGDKKDAGDFGNTKINPAN